MLKLTSVKVVSTVGCENNQSLSTIVAPSAVISLNMENLDRLFENDQMVRGEESKVRFVDSEDRHGSD